MMYSQSGACLAPDRQCREKKHRVPPWLRVAVALFTACTVLNSCQLDKLLSSGKLSDVPADVDPPGGSIAAVATRLLFDVQPANTVAAGIISPPIQVSARDEAGVTVTTFTGNITLEISTNPSTGTLAGTAMRAAVAGVATFSGMSINNSGSGYRLRANSGTLASATSDAFNITTAPVVPNTLLLVSGNGQTGTAGTALANPYVVQLRNPAGQGVAAATVTWTVVIGGGSIAQTSVTNSTGQASATHTLGSTVGAQRVTASVSGATGSPVTFDVTATAPPQPTPTRIELVSGNSQSDTISATLALPYVVKVTNASGNPVSGATVSWAVTGGSNGSITPATSSTNAQGLASATHKLGTIPGPHSVTAAVTGLQGSPITFTSTARHGNPSRLVFTQQPTDAERNKDIKPPILVTVQDRLGNVATSATGTITMSIVPLTGTLLAVLSGDVTKTPSLGVASFTNLRINLAGQGYRLRATSGGMTVDSNPFNITLGDQW